MSFDIQQFYQKLDQYYLAHDNSATKEFLYEMIEKTKSLHDVSIMPVSCPSCVETPTVNLEYVSVCNEAACFFRGISDYTQSLELFNQALNELALFYQKQTANYITILLNKAGTLRLTKRYQEAIEAFCQAENFYLEQTPQNGYLLASVYNNLSLVYQDIGQIEYAAAYTEKALTCLPEDVAYTVERATTYNNLAIIYMKSDNLTAASNAITLSIALLKELNAGTNAHYPAALNTYGSILFKSGNYSEAVTIFKEALLKTIAIYDKNIDYIYCCQYLAKTYELLHNTVQADFYTSEAQTIRSILFQEENKHE